MLKRIKLVFCTINLFNNFISGSTGHLILNPLERRAPTPIVKFTDINDINRLKHLNL